LKKERKERKKKKKDKIVNCGAWIFIGYSKNQPSTKQNASTTNGTRVIVLSHALWSSSSMSSTATDDDCAIDAFVSLNAEYTMPDDADGAFTSADVDW
jgi:hypothetical protein